MGKRIWQESLLTISQAGEGIYAYFSLFVAPHPVSLPIPTRVPPLCYLLLALGR